MPSSMPQHSASSYKTLWFPLATFLIGMIITWFAFENAEEIIQQQQRKNFENRVNEFIHAIEVRMAHYEQALKGTASFFDVIDDVTETQFAAYVTALNIEQELQGIQGIGFARWLPPQHDGLGAETEPRSVVERLEPLTWRNRRAIGYDMFAEPVRHLAMVETRDTGQTRISGKVRLVQETSRNVQAGFLMYTPLYRTKRNLDTIEERRAHLVGWMFAPFRAKDFIEHVLKYDFNINAHDIAIEIYDVNDVETLKARSVEHDTLLFKSHEDLHDDHTSPYDVHRHLNFYGRDWTLYAHPIQIPVSDEFDQAQLILYTGTTLSLLLALLMWLLTTNHTRAEALAHHMTQELRCSEQQQKRLNRSLQLTSQCHLALIHSTSEHHLVHQICQLCVDIGSYHMAWVAYTDADNPHIVTPVAMAGQEHGYLKAMIRTDIQNAITRGPTAQSAINGQVIVHQDLLSLTQAEIWPAEALARGYRACISVPLKGEPQNIGALSIYSTEPNAFTEEEVHLLKELANNLAFGIHTLRTKAQHEASEKKAAFLAHFDALTQLPNRLLLRDRFDQILITAQQENNRPFSLLFFDLDKFQEINDSFGHSVGDRVLLKCVERFRQHTPPSDTIGRLSSDEFVCILAKGDEASANDIANAILESFHEALDIDGQSIPISVSIGISVFPNNGQDFDTLLKCADTAVSQVKKDGGHALRFYTQNMNIDLKEQMRLANGMMLALKNQEFLLHYQPQIDLETGKITGAEALVRWKHPIDGMISPGRFIPLAERNGQILQIGEWVLNEACRQTQEWLTRYPGDFMIAVNMSALQFKRGNVLEVVTQALERSGLPAHCLELELTESMLMQDIDATLKTLHQLKELGIKLSIDDFGTGYSSLSYLQKLTVDRLKVDQSFVRDMLASKDALAIVRTIIQLGHSLQLNVLAEGVEHEEERDMLTALGCHDAQGYFFSRPLAADLFEQFYAKAYAQEHSTN